MTTEAMVLWALAAAIYLAGGVVWARLCNEMDGTRGRLIFVLLVLFWPVHFVARAVYMLSKDAVEVWRDFK